MGDLVKPGDGSSDVVRVASAAVAAAGVKVADPNFLEPVEVMSLVVLKTMWLAEAYEQRLRGSGDVAGDEQAAAARAFLEALTAARHAAVAAESAGMVRRRVFLEEGQVRAAFLAIDRAIRLSELSKPDEARLRDLVGQELAAVTGPT